MIRKLLHVIIVLFVCSSHLLSAQTPLDTLYIITNMDSTLNVCDDADTFKVLMINKSNQKLTNLVLKPNMPQGMVYKKVISGATAFNIDTPSNPHLQILLDTLRPQDTTIVIFTAVASCKIIDNIIAGNPIFNQTQVEYKINGNEFFAKEKNPNSFEVLYPDVIIKSISPRVFKDNFNKKTFQRKIVIANGGYGDVISFTLVDRHDSTLKIIALVLVDTMAGNDTIFPITYTDSLTVDSFIVDVGIKGLDSIQLIELLEIDNCADAAYSSISFSWGCEGQSCDKYTDYASVLVNLGQPLMAVGVETYTGANYCGSDATVIFRYTNNGIETADSAGMATLLNVVINYTQGISLLDSFMISADSVGPYTLLNPDSISGLIISGGNNGSWLIDFSNVTQDPDKNDTFGIGDYNHDSTFTELLIGSSFYIKAKIHLNCDPTFASECPLTYRHIYAQTTVNYSDKCFEKNISPIPVWVESETKGDCRTTDFAPPNMIVGDTATFQFCLHADMNGDLVCNNNQFRMIAQIPQGLIPVMDSVFFNSVDVKASFNNNTLVIYGGNNHGCYSVDFFLNCYEGAPIEKSLVINYEIEYLCDTLCACIQRLGCDSIIVNGSFKTCPNNSCPTKSMTTDTFNVQRITFGWNKSPDIGGVYVTQNTPGVRLNAAYIGDTIRMLTEGKMTVGSADSAIVRVEYLLHGNTNILRLVGSTAIANIIKSNGSIECANPSMVINYDSVNNGNSTLYIYEFNVKKCSTPNINFNAIRKLRIQVDFVVQEMPNYPEIETFEIPALKATFYALSGTNKSTCGGKGTRFYLLRPTNYFTTHDITTTINAVTARLDWSYYDCEIDNFPNEFRHLGRMLDTIKVVIPPNYVFISGSGRYVTTGGTGFISETKPALDIVQNDTIYFFTADNKWPVQDKNNNYNLQYFAFDLIPTCKSPDMGTIIYNYKWLEYDYAKDASFKKIRYGKSMQGIVNSKSQLSLIPHLLGSTGITDTVNFDFTMCNNRFGTDAYYTWLALENPSQVLNFIAVYDITDGANPLSLTLEKYYVGIDTFVWVKLGTLSQVTCRSIRFVARYKHCFLDPVVAITGKACPGENYPVNPRYGNSNISRNIFFDAKKANMQNRLLTTPGPTAFCDTSDYYVMEINSSNAGYLFEPSVSLCLPEGMRIVPGTTQFLHPVTGNFIDINDPVLSLGNCYIVNIDSSVSSLIAQYGMPGAIEMPDNRLQIRIKLIEECGFDIQNPGVVKWSTSAISNCKDTLELKIQKKPYTPILPEPAYVYQHILKVETFNICHPDSVLVNVMIVNNGSEITGYDDLVSVYLPAGANYAGEFSGINHAPLNPIPNQTGNILTWALPGGVLPKDTVHFTFFLTYPSNLSCGSVPFRLETERSDSAFCQSIDSICFIKKTIEGNMFFAPVLKPDLMIPNFVLHDLLFCDTIPDNISVKVKNTGNIAVSTGDLTTIDFYCDADKNGVISGGDHQVGNYTTTAAINPGQTIIASTSLSIACQHNEGLIAVVDANKQCICKTNTAIYISLKADFVANSTCLGSPVCVNNTSITTLPSTYSWTFSPDGIPISSTAENICVFFSMPGLKTIQLIATDSCGSDTITKVIQVFPLPVATAGNDTTICEGDTITIGGTPTASGGSGGYNYFWSPFGGLSNINASNPLAHPTKTTTYTLMVADVFGCKDTASVTIIVHSLPVANAGMDTIITPCTDSVQLGFFPKPSLIYTWLPISGLSDVNISNPKASPSFTTNYILEVTNTYGCKATDEVIVIVLDSIFAGNDTTVKICSGDNIQIGISPLSSLTYYWMPSNGLSNPNIANPIASPTNTTTYLLIAADGSGCSDSSTTTVKVNPLPTAFAGNDTAITACVDPVPLGAPPVTGLSYNWQPSNDLSSATVSNPLVSTTHTTNYILTVTDTNGCFAIDSVYVIVNRDSMIAFAGNDTTINSCNDSIQLGAPLHQFFTYNWTPTIGLSKTNISNPMALVTNTTTYILMVSDAGGCLDVDSVTVAVNSYLDVSITTQGSQVICNDQCITLTAHSPGCPQEKEIIFGGPSEIIHDPNRPQETTEHFVKGDHVVIREKNVLVNFGAGEHKIIHGPGDVEIIHGPTQKDLSSFLCAFIWSTGANNQSITVCDSGVYWVAMQDSNGCFAYDSIFIEKSKNQSPFANAGEDKTIDCGQSVEIGPPGKKPIIQEAVNYNSPDNFTYEWIPADSLNNPNIRNPIASPIVTTTYILIVTNVHTGCSSFDTVTVFVIEPQLVRCSFAGAEPVKVSVCAFGECTEIGCPNVLLTDACPSPTFTWMSDKDGLLPYTTPTICINVTEITTFIVTIIGCNSPCMQRDTFTVVPLFADFSVDAGRDTSITICSKDSIQLGEASVSGRIYNWTPIAGLSNTNISNPKALPSTTTNYVLSVIDTVFGGCIGIDSVTITVVHDFIVDAGADTTINSCVDDSIMLGGNSMPGFIYSWVPSTGLSSSSVSNPKAFPGSTTTYALTVSNAADSCSISDSIIVTVTRLPIEIAITDTVVVCESNLGDTTVFAYSVIAYSSQWSSTDWSAKQVLGLPDVYPSYGDFAQAWASLTSNDQREFLELHYNTPMQINAISIYETFYPGAVDTVYVKNPNTNQWEMVYSGIAAPAGNTSRIFTVSFPLTAYLVSDIRIAINSPAVTPGDGNAWNEIDAVGIHGPLQTSQYGLTLTASGGNTYQWSTGQTTASVFVTQTDTYYVTSENNNGCQGSDTIQVIITNPPLQVDLGNDTTICDTSTLILDAGTGFNSYQWSTGSNNQTITVTTAGTYWVTVADSIIGCSAHDTVVVNTTTGCDICYISANLGNDTTICNTDTLELNAGAGFIGYQWSTGSENQKIRVTAAGIYWVVVEDTNKCRTIDSILVNTTTGCDSCNLSVTLGNDTTICDTSTLVLDAGAEFISYLWSGSSTNQTLNISSAGLYWVEVTDINGCVGQDTVLISSKICDSSVTVSECCIDSTLIDGNANCLALWDPVCGCNRNTYSNSCYAESFNGVRYWKPGICNDSCTIQTSYIYIRSGNNYNFTNTTSGSSSYTISWNFGDGNTSMEQHPQHTYTNTGVYLVTLRVDDISDSTCFNIHCETIVVDSIVIPTCSLVASYTQSVYALTATFTNTSTPSGTFTSEWTFGDDNTSSSASPFHQYSVAGTYLVCLSVRNNNDTSCVSNFCDSVTVTDTCSFEVLITSNSPNICISPLDTVFVHSVIDFSTQYGSEDNNWSANEVIGQPDVYPSGGDFATAWSPDSENSIATNGREFLELYYIPAVYANGVIVYETWNPGTVDTVYVKNPITNQWDVVYSGAATQVFPTNSNDARVFTVNFPLTSYKVSEVRVAFNTGAVPSWNEIDAIGLIGHESVESVVLTVNNGDTFQWSTGSNNQTINVTTAGTYWVTVADTTNSCSASDTIVVIATSCDTLGCNFQVNITITDTIVVCESILGDTTVFADSVIAFSSQWELINWSAEQVLGTPDVYPAYGDILQSWASLTPNAQREFLELHYNTPMQINAVSIYETFYPGSVDTVYVKNPNNNLWEIVYSGTAAPAGDTSRIFTVSFPLTAYLVSDIRIAINSPAVTPGDENSWNEIDAVSIHGPLQARQYGLTLTASGGNTYQWSTGQTTPSIFVTQSDTYYVTAEDSNGCEGSDTIQIIITNPPFQVDLGNDTTICNNNTLILDAGVGFNSYQWSTGSNNQTISVTTAGTYWVTVADTNGCVGQDTIVITTMNCNNCNLTVNIGNDTIICQDSTLILDAGAGSISYLWSDNSTSQILTVSIAGIYWTVVTDSSGCSASDTINILSFDCSDSTICDSFTISITGSNATCIGSINGSISVSVSGGSSYYKYEWFHDDDNLLNTPVLSNLVTGQYTVRVIDNLFGCSELGSYRIVEILSDMQVNIASRDACIDTCTGEIDVFVVGGMLPYSFIWNNETTSRNQIGLCPGNYQVTITDSFGCQIIDSIDINESEANCDSSNKKCSGFSGYAIVENANCPDECDGTINLIITGGTYPFIYNWSNGQTIEDPIELCSGSYFIIATDSNGCKFKSKYRLYDKMTECTGTCFDLTVTGEVINESYPGACDGEININVDQTFPGTLYKWGNNVTQNNNSYDEVDVADTIEVGDEELVDLANLCVGTYSLTVTDSSGRIATKIFTVGSNNVTYNPDMTFVISTENALCPETDPAHFGSQGEAMIIVHGGTPPYTYQWTNQNSQILSTTRRVSELTPTLTYYISVTDSLGMQKVEPVIVGYDYASCNDVPKTPCDSLLISLNGTSSSCADKCDGKVNLTVSGGQAPYCFLWNTGATTQNISSLCTGEYSVMVLDSYGCFIGGTFEIVSSDFTAFFLSDSTSCPDVCDGSLFVTTAGGIPPYTYLWNTGAITREITSLCSGTYGVTVTSGNGCITIGNYNVVPINPNCPDPCVNFNVSLQAFNATCETECDGSVIQTVSNGTSPIIYKWNNGASVRNLFNICAGSYTVTTIDGNGCTDTSAISVGINNLICPECQNFTASVLSTKNALCPTICDGEIRLSVFGGQQPYTYQWSDDQNQNTLNAKNLCAGTFSVTITDNKGCQITITSTIGNDNVTCPPLCETLKGSVTVVDALTTNEPSCPTYCDGKIILEVTGGTAPYSYNWVTTGKTASTIDSLCPGSYSCIITDSGLCEITVYAVVSTSDECDDEYLAGICFNNYGVFVNVPGNSGLNVYGHVFNEKGGDNDGGLFVNAGHIRVSKDWNNFAGNYAFDNSQNGVVEMIGGRQWFRGSDPTQFNELILMNPHTKKLMAVNQFVKGLLELRDAEMATRDNILTINTYDLNAVKRLDNEVGFVSSATGGWFRRYMNTDLQYHFQTGSSYGIARYRPVTLVPYRNISSNIVENHIYGVRFANIDPETDGYIRDNKELNIKSINSEYYHLIDQFTGNDSVDVTFGFDHVNDALFQSVVHWDDINPALWRVTRKFSLNIDNDPLTLSEVSIGGWNDFSHHPFALARTGFFINTENFGGTGVTYVVNGDGLPINVGDGTDGPLTPTGQGNADCSECDLVVPDTVGGNYIVSVQEGADNVGVDISFTMDNSGNMSAPFINVVNDDATITSYPLADDLWADTNYTIIFYDTPKDIGPDCQNTIQVHLNANDSLVLRTGDLFTITGVDYSLGSNLNLKIFEQNNLTPVYDQTGSNIQSQPFSSVNMNPGVYSFKLTVGLKDPGGNYSGNTHLFKGQFFIE